MESMTDWAFSWPISAQRVESVWSLFVVENWERGREGKEEGRKEEKEHGR